jgi:hypothetical protein
MKKLLIFGITVLSLMGCSKNGATPDTLTNTFWTGFFTYDGVKHYPFNTPLKQVFGMEFLADGKFKFYEAAGISGGTWKLNSDNTILVNQDNKNRIEFRYDAANQKVTFLKMTGAPLPWQAFEIEYSPNETISTISDFRWYDSDGYPIIFRLNPTPRVEWSASIFATVAVKNNLIWGKSPSNYATMYMYRPSTDRIFQTYLFDSQEGQFRERKKI